MQVVHLAAQGSLRKATERQLDKFPQQILLGGLVLNALGSMWYLMCCQNQESRRHTD